MNTFLFDDIIFGPVRSRRLGTSLGINLLPTNFKLCNFDCIYCECGLNNKLLNDKVKLYPHNEIIKALENKLQKLQEKSETLDSITFAGNGEPTLHPEFPLIIEETIKLRNRYYPETKISVLSNSTTLNDNNIVNSLLSIENIILKLDSGIERTIKAINNPTFDFNLFDLLDNLTKFKGRLTIQTLFLKGIINGVEVDNSTAKEVEEWIKLLKIIAPQHVMLYTFSRNTPIDTLEKVSVSRMNEIAYKLREIGFNAEVYN